MKKNVVIEAGALVTSLGSMHATTEALLKGSSAIQPPPAFGIPVAQAPFRDPALRNPDNAFSQLKNECDLSPIIGRRILFIYAAAKGDIRALEPDPHSAASAPSPLLTDQAQRAGDILGVSPVKTIIISNACASGLVALSVASRYLELGFFSYALVAGFDVVSHFVTSGFHSLGALSPAGARPFDVSRDGLTLGDGAALALLSCREPRKGDCIIAGTDQTNDANHRTGPSRTGDGLCRAAAGALKKAGCTPEETGAIKCHGTATAFNDAMEAKAINRLFPSALPPCFSVKGAIGHTSGAGSLIETLLAAEFLKVRTIPPTAGFSIPDPDAQVSIAGYRQPITCPTILCLSAGFGGLNAALLLREVTNA